MRPWDERNIFMSFNPIAINDPCAARLLANAALSPEGKTACFTASQAKKERNCCDPRPYFLRDGRVRALTLL